MCNKQADVVVHEQEFNRGIIVLQHSGCSTHFVLQKVNEESRTGCSFTNILSGGSGLALNNVIAGILQGAGVNIFSEEIIKLGSIKQQLNRSLIKTNFYVPLLDCGRRQLSSVEELTRRNVGGLIIYNIHSMNEEIVHNCDPYFLAIAARLIARKLIYC